MIARLAAAVLVFAPVVQAAESAHACARLRDRNQRLDCYDAAFGKPADEVAPVPAPAPTAPSAASGENFGLTQQQIDRNAPPDGTGKVERIASSVVAMKRGHDGKFIVTLENGQVWAQIEVAPSATMAVGDAVTIRRAAMGSYLLVTPRGIATRVRRRD